MIVQKPNSIRAVLMRISVPILVVFLAASIVLLFGKYRNFSDEVDYTYGGELINQTARDYQEQFSRAEAILQRLCSNPELSEYMGEEMDPALYLWTSTTLYNYGMNSSIIDSVSLLSPHQNVSYGNDTTYSSFEKLFQTSAIQRAMKDNTNIILISENSAEKEELDSLLGNRSAKYYMIRCFNSSKAGPIIVLARIKRDCISDTIPANLVVFSNNILEYSEQLSNAEVDLLVKATQDKSVFQNRLSVEFYNGNFQVFYVQDLIEDTNVFKGIVPVLVLTMLVLTGIGVGILVLSSRVVIQSLQDLKNAAEQYEKEKSKEHRIWFLLRKRTRSLRETVVRILLLSLIPPLLVGNIAGNLFVRKEADRIEKHYRNQQCQQVYDYIDLLFNERISMMVAIAYDSRMQTALQNGSLQQIDNVMRDYGYLFMVNDDFYLYDADYELLTTTDRTEKKVLSVKELEENEVDLNGDQWLIEHNMVDVGGSMRFLHWIKDISTGKILGVLQCEMSILELTNCWENSSINYVTIADGKGEIIYSNAVANGEKTQDVPFVAEESWKQPYSSNRLRITTGTTAHDSTLFVMEVTSLQLLLLLLLFLIIFVAAQTAANKMIEQLVRIETATNNIFKGFRPGENTLKKFPENLAITEFSELGESFNQMAERIEVLMDQIVVSTNRDAQLRAEKRQVDALAMQLQINPHFMYNTLESISCVIAMDRRNDAEEMVTILGELFRYSVDQKKLIVPLEEEIKMLEKYLRLMNIRLNGNIHYTFDIPQELYKVSVMKFLLQPIFENIFIHGGNNDNCHVVLRVWEDDNNMIFCVEDNGNGILPEQLIAINKDLQSGTKRNSIGLCNVNSRLKIVYGPEYGLYLESVPKHYTKVFLRLPPRNTLT